MEHASFVSELNFLPDARQGTRVAKGISIMDTTLRDGEQTPSVVFSPEERVEIAKMLGEIGVEQIEAGIPAVSHEDVETIKRIVELGLKPQILCWCRASKGDVDAAAKTGAAAVAISLPTSDLHVSLKLKNGREGVLAMLAETVQYAKQHGFYVCFNAEDGTRSDPAFLAEYVRTGKEAGADRFRLCDTVGALLPRTTRYLVALLKEKTALPIEMHCHNDYGLAVANTLAAIDAGAEWASTTVNGIGERAGNASLAETLLALRNFYGVTKYNTKVLKPLASFVEKASNIRVPITAPVIGANAFTHESGIHVQGVLANPATYETFAPELVGNARRIAIGKHSGKHGIMHKARELGIELDAKSIEMLREKIRTLARKKKDSLSDEEFAQLVNETIPR
jgi:homocitrate synthase NifV